MVTAGSLCPSRFASSYIICCSFLLIFLIKQFVAKVCLNECNGVYLFVTDCNSLDTNAYKSEYIYKLTNILNFTNKLEDGYAILKQNKNKINVDLIDNLDQMLHDIDYFENGSFKLNEIEKLFLV